MTSLSHCHSLPATGWALHYLRPKPTRMRSVSIAKNSRNIRTTAGHCAACSRLSRSRVNLRNRSRTISHRVGLDRTPGSAHLFFRFWLLDSACFEPTVASFRAGTDVLWTPRHSVPAAFDPHAEAHPVPRRSPPSLSDTLAHVSKVLPQY